MHALMAIAVVADVILAIHPFTDQQIILIPFGSAALALLTYSGIMLFYAVTFYRFIRQMKVTKTTSSRQLYYVSVARASLLVTALTIV